ncbi:centrosomal protein of 44 kDa [Erpetoichthys calabaricus]|uniref:Centrosomal protein of 44 kDa n=1 Tax=Erpetoichthys calabaricus TaxID=27687 RepID=A0A8C4T192_ERPCA|nr:centrosomal protein of 44 kDa [Erpetoichthys calabaricus]
MATGDLKGCLRKLDQLLRSINYSREVDYPGLARGDPVSVLPIISYAFNSFSLLLAEHFVACGVELTGKNDLRLLEGVYKVLRDHFHYKPVLSKQQFLQSGYAERKITITCDIITYLINKHKELSKSQPKKRLPSVPSSAPSQGGHERLFPDLPYKAKPLVEKHVVGFVDSRPCSPSSHSDSEFIEDDDDDDSLQPKQTKAPCVQDVSVCHPVLRSRPPGTDGIERPAGCFTSSVGSSHPTLPQPCVGEVNAMAEDTQLRDLRQQLSECQEKIQKLSVMEERLRVVEEEMKGKVIIDRLEWDNLVSRLVLLETEWILSSTKNDSSLNRVTGSPTLPPEDELDQATLDSRSKTPESRLHNSSGYDSILSTDASPSAADINSLVLTEVSKAWAKEPLSHSSSRGASASLSLVQSHARERLQRIGHLMKETAELLKCAEEPS